MGNMNLGEVVGGAKSAGRRLPAPALLLAALLSPAPAAPAGAAFARAAAQAAQHEHGAHGPKPAAPRYTRTVASYATPDVTFTDAGSRKVRLASVLGGGGAVMLQFIFTTCPTVCPVMSATFAAAQSRLGPGSGRVRMVSISIDPEHGTPERLREYARRFKAGPRWLFLTGEAEDIRSVRKAFDAYPGDNKMRHRPLTFLRVSPGRPWVRLDGLTGVAQLLAEYERLNEQ